MRGVVYRPRGSRTAGLNNPPLTLKKIHALTAKLKPKLKAIYKSTLVSDPVMVVFVMPCSTSLVLATWVPPVDWKCHQASEFGGGID